MKLSINNFRDVSGYVNKDGKVMKKNRIFRGASLHNLTDEEAEYLEKELHIRYVFDYRDHKEAETKPDVVSKGTYYERISALKVGNPRFEGFDFGELLSNNMSKENMQFMIEYLQDGYMHMPFKNEAYQKLFECLLKNDGNVYYHCSAGKDRTGVATFLIMIALGISEEEAIREYLLSNQYLESFVQGFYKEKQIPIEYRKYCDVLLYVCEDNIQLTIEKIKERYSDYDSFLEAEYELTKEKREQLVSIYCE